MVWTDADEGAVRCVLRVSKAVSCLFSGFNVYTRTSTIALLQMDVYPMYSTLFTYVLDCIPICRMYRPQDGIPGVFVCLFSVPSFVVGTDRAGVENK